MSEALVIIVKYWLPIATIALIGVGINAALYGQWVVVAICAVPVLAVVAFVAFVVWHGNQSESKEIGETHDE